MKQDDAEVGGGHLPGAGQTDERGTLLESTADLSAGLYACPTCGENVTRYGQRCDRCTRNIEEDRLERESGR